MIGLLKRLAKALPPVARLLAQRDALAAEVADLRVRLDKSGARSDEPRVAEHAPRPFPIDRIPMRKSSK